MAITVELSPEIEARLIAQAKAQGITAEAFLAAEIENLLKTEPQVYKVGTALVVQSIPIDNVQENQVSYDDSLDQKEDIAWLETDLSNLSEYEPYEWRSGELEQGMPVEIDLNKGVIIIKDDC